MSLNLEADYAKLVKAVADCESERRNNPVPFAATASLRVPYNAALAELDQFVTKHGKPKS